MAERVLKSGDDLTKGVNELLQNGKNLKSSRNRRAVYDGIHVGFYSGIGFLIGGPIGLVAGGSIFITTTGIYLSGESADAVNADSVEKALLQ